MQESDRRRNRCKIHPRPSVCIYRRLKNEQKVKAASANVFPAASRRVRRSTELGKSKMSLPPRTKKDRDSTDVIQRGKCPRCKHSNAPVAGSSHTANVHGSVACGFFAPNASLGSQYRRGQPNSRGHARNFVNESSKARSACPTLRKGFRCAAGRTECRVL